MEPVKSLYEGSDITLEDSFAAVFVFSLRHGLTKKATADLIELISLHLPHGTNGVRSLYQLKKQIRERFEDLEVMKHYYCKGCLALLKSDAPCDGPLCLNTKNGTFVTTSIAAQVKRRLEGMYTNILTLDDAMTFIYRGISDPAIWKCMQTRFDINSDGNIHDIYDGLNYVQHTCPGGFLSRDFPANVSFCLNTDGIQLFKSSAIHFWPIWLTINELPQVMRCMTVLVLIHAYNVNVCIRRYSKMNMILAGLWYDHEEPAMATFLQPVLESINVFYHEGDQCIVEIYVYFM